MRRLAIFTIIGILALAGCGGSAGSSPAVGPTTESGERSSLAEPGKLSSDKQASETGTGKAKNGAKTRESRMLKAGPGPTPVSIAGPGICGRTPEIQNKLISELQITSCRVIHDAELYGTWTVPWPRPAAQETPHSTTWPHRRCAGPTALRRPRFRAPGPWF